MPHVNSSPKMDSWQNVSSWYSSIVGEKGHYFHQNIVIPNSLKLLNLTNTSTVLDLACGQGVLARYIPEQVKYVGIDSSAALVKDAIQLDKNLKHQYKVGDATNLQLDQKFSHAALILALQNIQNAFGVIKTASENLQPKGKFLIVINHPAFRVPRHSAWQLDEKDEVQHRLVDRYLSKLEIPILLNPSKQENSQVTFSYHLSISAISDLLNKNGFVIEKIEEWISDKTSVGRHAKAENTSRNEIPMFMAILAEKH